MKKRLVPILSLITVTFILTIIFGFIVIVMFAFDEENALMVKYFTDIEQFDAMNEYVTKDLAPDDDKYLKDIPYVESYTKQLEFKGKKYQVYAYEFNSIEDAEKYYEACGGKEINYRFNYEVETMRFSKPYCVSMYDKYVHFFRGGKRKDFVEAYNCLTGSFPVCYKTIDKPITDADFGFYQFYGDETFSNLINTNPIDPYILAKYDQAENDYVSLSFVTSEECTLWEAELENALKELRLCLEGEDLAKFNETQTAWEADTEADISWQIRLCVDMPWDKEAAVIKQDDAAYALGLYEADLYKQRTIEVKYFHYLYDKNADLSFVFEG